MTLVIGTDEAGYGPNLGPLVVTATLWEIDETVEALQLFEALVHVSPHDGTHLRVPVDDSEKGFRVVDLHGIQPATADLHGLVMQTDQRRCIRLVLQRGIQLGQFACREVPAFVSSHG